jgi:ankyrin repeat protein
MHHHNTKSINKSCNEESFIISSHRGYINAVESYMNDNVNINVQNKDGNTALIMASMKGHYNICKLLIDNNCNVNIQNNIGNTALIVASYYNYYKIVELLIDNNAEPNVQNYRGDTALIWATIQSNDDIVKLLLDNGWNSMHELPLINASINNNYKLVQLLIDRGIDINKESPDGYTGLMMASDYKNYDVFKLLINHGAYYNNIDIIQDYMIDYIIKVDNFKSNIYKLAGNSPVKYFFINNILLVKLLSKSKVIYHNTGIPKSIIMLIGSYFFY